MQHIFQFGGSRTWVFLPFWKISNHQSSQTKQFTNSQSLHEDPASKTRSKHLQPSFFHHMFFLFQLPILSFMVLLHEIANYNPNTFLKNRIGEQLSSQRFHTDTHIRFIHRYSLPKEAVQPSLGLFFPVQFFEWSYLHLQPCIPTIFFFHFFFGGWRKSAVAVIFRGSCPIHPSKLSVGRWTDPAVRLGTAFLLGGLTRSRKRCLTEISSEAAGTDDFI